MRAVHHRHSTNEAINGEEHTTRRSARAQGAARTGMVALTAAKRICASGVCHGPQVQLSEQTWTCDVTSAADVARMHGQATLGWDTDIVHRWQAGEKPQSRNNSFKGASSVAVEKVHLVNEQKGNFAEEGHAAPIFATARDAVEFLRRREDEVDLLSSKGRQVLNTRSRVAAPVTESETPPCTPTELRSWRPSSMSSTSPVSSCPAHPTLLHQSRPPMHTSMLRYRLLNGGHALAP